MKKKLLFSSIFAIMATIFIFASPGTTKASMLETEAQGPEVTALQQDLIQMGYLHTNATGYYGSATAQAVEQFQSDFGLTVDGAAGTQTTSRMDEVTSVAKAVYGEARGEAFEGQIGVAAVILNRLESPEFPNNVNGVIQQQNAFTAVADGQYNMTPDQTAYEAVKQAWNGYDPSQGSMYYYNPEDVTSDWIWTRTPNLSIGQHVFAS
ncbi:cell wall hydrolase [Marinococcus luteus]|uniref:cell wall hydrolase n=1 Tax=Marinococcus luteus TaxID=1122204 RepID=UPI002ACC50AE|nr:cell wall hydrolase [Marinococcus luteus]MDZ5784419.1 cell wall hydrolase [Marinococcus luteus]